MTLQLPLSEALEADYERLGITQLQFAERLKEKNPDGDISNAAISMWKSRAKIPKAWQKPAVEVLGADSLLAKWLEQDFARKWSFSSADIHNQLQERTSRILAAFEQMPGLHLEQEVARELPEPMGRYIRSADETDLFVGSHPFFADFVSPRVVVEFKAVSDTLAPPVYKALFQLAAVRAFNRDRRVYGLIGINTSDRYPTNASRPKFEAEMLGVRFEIVENAKAAAKLILAWEIGEREVQEQQP